MDHTAHPRPSVSGRHGGRLHGYDVVRGFSVCSMVAFHFCYDLKFLVGVPLTWFAPPLQDLWRATISWTFLFVAGCMCSYSHSNLRRAGRYLGVACVIFVVTSLADVDAPISFGIIYCMGVCTLVAHVLSLVGKVPTGPGAASLLMLAFLIVLRVPSGLVGIGPASMRLPSALYASPLLSWLGFPGPGFVSSDYYPPIPYLLMYLAGMAMGSYWKQHGVPAWLEGLFVPPLEFVGRHALEIYLLHQPVLLLVSTAIATLA